jgi:hypothetical protein
MNLQTNLKIIGEITARFYDQSSLNFFEKLWNRFVILSGLDKKKWYILGNLVRQEVKKNIICTTGLNVLARRLATDNTYSGNINKMALGTGTGSFNGAETQLYNETYRNNTASYTSEDNVAYITAYFTETEVSGNFSEFGNFIDGGAGANTGKLWTHVSVSWSKSTTETLVVDCKYTLTSA